jgi:VanZ family protein
MTLKSILKVCCLVALVVLLFFGLGPAKLQPRSGLGWQVDHFVGYFVLTLIFCVAWTRPFVVAALLAVFAVVLEALQALTTDRSSNAEAAFYSVCGVLAGALIAKVSMRAWRRFQSNRAKTHKI